MKTPIRIVATVLAATLATSSMTAPASAFFFGGHGKHFFFKKKFFKHKKTPGGGGSKFPWPVACVMGSAFGLISAATIKGGGLQLMSQKEFETTPRDRTRELTSEEAAAIGFTCGLGAIPVIASFRQQPQPAPIRTRY